MAGKHRFPLNPDSKLTSMFYDLCDRLSFEEVGDLSREISKAVHDFSKLKDSPLAPDLKLVSSLETAARVLLERYSSETPENQKLIAGAVRYFTTSRDIVHDHRPLVGLDDDIL